jgi:hypothetical protein
MTREHIFFVSFIFALGFVAGALATSTRAKRHRSDDSRRPGGRAVVVAIVTLAVVFVATHVFSTHGGVRHIEDLLRGQAVFDQRPSFTAAEVHARLESFGVEGRAAYRRMTYTSDLVFPLALFYFLFQLVRFVIGSTTVPAPGLARFASFAPVLWLTSDLAENALIYYLLGEFPQRCDHLAGILGVLTYLKFALLVASLALPAALLWRDSRR